MPKAHQTVIEPLVTVWGLGYSDSKLVASSFPAGPIGGKPKPTNNLAPPQPLSNDWIKLDFLTKVMRGEVKDSAGYYGAIFNRNYAADENLDGALGYVYKWSAYAQGGSGQLEPGQPINSFVPNLVSVQDADPLNAFDPPGEKMKTWANAPARRGSAPFVGPGTALSPKMSADKLNHAPGWPVKDIGAGAEKAEMLGVYDLGNANAGG